MVIIITNGIMISIADTQISLMAGGTSMLCLVVVLI